MIKSDDCADHTCLACGKIHKRTFRDGPELRVMREMCYCFGCAFWQVKAEAVPQDLQYAVIEGHCYYVGDERASRHFRGMGGRPFDIEWFDGRRIRSTNLWSNGTIPAHFRSAIPDNARFLHGAGKALVGDTVVFQHSQGPVR